MMKENLKKIFFPRQDQKTIQIPDEKTSQVPDFETFIDLVLAIPEEYFFQKALEDDPIYGRLTRKHKQELVAEARSCGSQFAQEALKQSKNIFQLLKEEQIDYSNPDKPNGGSYVIFAQYTEPNHITVFQDSVAKFLELVATTKYRSFLTEERLKSLLLAHEYFHYLEFSHEKTIVTKTKKMVLWRFLGYAYQTRFICLSEMSAMVFAKTYTDFPYSPYILDCLLTYAYNKELSYKIYQSIKRD
ncbi:hypothetical protein [Streptococcus dentiloxodontae]